MHLRPDMVTHTCNPSSRQEAEAGRLEASLGYIVMRPCLKKGKMLWDNTVVHCQDLSLELV